MPPSPIQSQYEFNLSQLDPSSFSREVHKLRNPSFSAYASQVAAKCLIIMDDITASSLMRFSFLDVDFGGCESGRTKRLQKSVGH